MIRIKYPVINISDFLMFIMIVSTLAFHDQTKVMVLVQIVTFGYLFLNHMRRGYIGQAVLKFLVWWIIFWSWGVLSLVWASYISKGLQTSISLCQIILIGANIFLYCKDESKIIWMVNSCIVACGVLIVRLFIKVPINAWGTERIGQYLGSGNSGGYGNTNATYVLSFAVVLVFYLYDKNKNMLQLAVLSSTYTIISLLTGSKKALFILIIVIALRVVLCSKDYKKMIRNILLVIVLAGISTYMIYNIPILYNAVGQRMEGMINGITGKGVADASTNTRIGLTSLAIEAFIDYPIGGLGISNFASQNIYNCWAENNILELLANLGIVGFIAYYIFPVTIVFESLRNRDKKPDEFNMIISMIVCVTAMDVSAVSHVNDFIQTYMFLAYAAYFVVMDEVGEIKITEFSI